MKNYLKSSFAILSLAFIILAIGFYNFTGKKTIQLKPLSEFLALNQDLGMGFPFDISRYSALNLKCKNSSGKNKTVSLTALAGESGAAYSFLVKKGTSASKKVSTLLTSIGLNAKAGVLFVTKDEGVSCSLVNLDGVTIEEGDLTSGITYLQDAPTLVNTNLTQTKSNDLIIHNTSLEDGTFSVLSYLEDGTLDSEDKVTVKALTSYTLPAKNKTPKTYQVISDGSHYLAYVRAKIAGRNYTSKPIWPFENAFFASTGGTLIASNITSAPATFHYYVIGDDGKKAYEGTEWVLPYGQRKIDLTPLSKITNSKMAIVQESYYLPKKCDDKGKCWADEAFDNASLVMNHLQSKTKSPNAVSESSEIPSDDVLYGEKVNKKLAVSCKIDDIVKPYCGIDQNSNGIDDAEEVFHYFADPEKEDADGDGYSNAEEIAAGTKAFHPFDFPGVPTEDTIEGMYQIARMIESYAENKKAQLDDHLSPDAIADDKDDYLVPISQTEATYQDLIYGQDLCGLHDLVNFACSGINLCITSNDTSRTNAFAEVVQGCLNVMRQAVSRMVGNGCRHCKGDVTVHNVNYEDKESMVELFKECSAANNVLIGFTLGKDGRNGATTSARAIAGLISGLLANGDQISESKLDEYENAPEWNIVDIFDSHIGHRSQTGGVSYNSSLSANTCHELGHLFYNAVDRYSNVLEIFDSPPSLYAAQETQCFSGYDILNLQLNFIRNQTDAFLSDVIDRMEECTYTTETGKKLLGKRINYGKFVGDCIAIPFTPEQQYCPPNGDPTPDMNFPSGKEPFEPECFCNFKEIDGKGYCCEDINFVPCNGECCYHTCVLSGGVKKCCKLLVKVNGKQYCCDDLNLENVSVAIKNACNSAMKCEPGEKKYTDENGNVACCPITKVVEEKDGTIKCCSKFDVSCGGTCCPVNSCLESQDGNGKTVRACCPSTSPYACPKADGKGECCQYGCGNFISDRPSGLCLQCPPGRAACGPDCCEDKQECNEASDGSYACKDCGEKEFCPHTLPNAKPRCCQKWERCVPQIGCMPKECPDGRPICGTECCGDNQACLYDMNGDSCVDCPAPSTLCRSDLTNTSESSGPYFESCCAGICNHKTGMCDCPPDQENCPSRVTHNCCQRGESCDTESGLCLPPEDPSPTVTATSTPTSSPRVSSSPTGIPYVSITPKGSVTPSPTITATMTPTSTATANISSTPTPSAVCKYGDRCIQPSRGCVGTILSESIPLGMHRCENVDGCLCCVDTKDSGPDYCPQK